MTKKMNDDEIVLGLGEVQQQLASTRTKLKEREAADTEVAERLRNLMSTCFDGSRSGDLAYQLADMEEWIPKFTSEWKANHRRWLELCTRLGRVAEVEAVAGDALELKRIRSIVDEDARKRHGAREGEPSWGVIADCVLAHVSQHRQARKSLDVPEQVTLDQYVAETSQYLRVFETSLVNAGKWDPYPELPLNLLAREIVAQAERWRIDAEHYRGEASNATAAMVESLSAEVARLTGEVAATRAEAARQISVRDAERAALVTRAQRLAIDLTSEASECTAHGLVSPATALRGAAALNPSSGAAALRHTLAAQLRAAAKTASAWEEAAIQEWAPLAPDYHDGDGTVTAAIEGPYIEHRLVMAWRGQVQRMADNLSADESPPTPIQRLDYSLLPLGYTMEEDVDADDVSICLWLWSSDADTDGRAKRFGAECTSEADAIIDAWSDWKKSNDPPGLTVESFEDGASWIRGAPELRRWDSPDEARAAAWAWYDHRLALHERLRSGLGDRLGRCDGLDFWPVILAWSDAQVAEVERWLVDSTVEMPEVLRG